MGEQYTPSPTFPQTIFTEALRLASLGYKVHPVHGINDAGLCTCGRGPDCTSPGKHPVLSGWVEAASSDPATINSWEWGRGYNLGIVPGSALIILDFDGPEGRLPVVGIRQMPDDVELFASTTREDGRHRVAPVPAGPFEARLTMPISTTRNRKKKTTKLTAKVIASTSGTDQNQ